MTAQALPPSLDQQLADARTATAVAEQKAAHWQGVADDQRKEVDALTAANIALWSKARGEAELARAQRITELVDRLVAVEQERDTLKAKNARLDRQNDDLAAEHETLRHEASEARIGAQAANNAMYHAIRRERETEAKLKRCIDHHQKALEARDTLVRQLAALTQFVGAETPIAAFDLATTWYAEKAAYQEEIAAWSAAALEAHDAS